MTADPVVVALDIGTAHTTALVAAVHGDLPRAPRLKVLGVGHTRTMGLRRGVVSDIEEATRSIRAAVEEAGHLFFHSHNESAFCLWQVVFVQICRN